MQSVGGLPWISDNILRLERKKDKFVLSLFLHFNYLGKVSYVYTIPYHMSSTAEDRFKSMSTFDGVLDILNKTHVLSRIRFKFNLARVLKTPRHVRLSNATNCKKLYAFPSYTPLQK